MPGLRLHQNAAPRGGLRIDGAGLNGVLHLTACIRVYVEGLRVEEVDLLLNRGVHTAVRGVDEAADGEGPVGADRDRARDYTAGAGREVFVDLRGWSGAESVADQAAADLFAAMVTEDEHVRGGKEEG